MGEEGVGDGKIVSGTQVEKPVAVVADASIAAELAGVNGEPALEEFLLEKGADLSVERVCRLFAFPLDAFQKKAIGHMGDGKSVVVCAPTGAGKTAIAEAAAAVSLARGQRVIYTTPLKALSNQKLQELRTRFGPARCGLQTGDSSLNTDADIVVMTTEILRNIMYRTAEVGEDAPSVNLSATREARLGDVGCIVLDEVHYLGDPSRGSVWEEVIINCPRHIQLLCMSATVKNPDDLGGWISKEHQECVTIKTKFRPVPLAWHFAFKNAKGVNVLDLLDPTGKALNPKLEHKEVMLEEARFLLDRGQRDYNGYHRPGDFPAREYGRDRDRDRGADRRGGSGGGGGGGDGRRGGGSGPPWEQTVQRMMFEDSGAMQRRVNLIRVPPMDRVIRRLARLNYLPAIWFILSRKDCDLNAIKAGQMCALTSEEEIRIVSAEIEALRADQPEAVREKLVEALLAGFASHHAGHLPGWKTLIEKLFQRGLIKIVFATGTLAAGINMPARTTIISALGRKTDDGIKLVPHNELLQMAGRAGRRGYDTEGHTVVLQNRFEGAEEAFKIIKAGPEPLTSQFTASYGLVLNLLSVYTVEEARQFVLRSFGNFLQTEGQVRRLAEAEALEAKAKELLASSEDKADGGSSTAEAVAAMRTARTKLRNLKARALAERISACNSVMEELGLPRKVVLQVTQSDTDAPQLLPAVVVGRVPADQVADLQPSGVGKSSPFYACLGADNRLVRASAVHVVSALEGEEGGMVEADAAVVQGLFDAVHVNGWTSAAKGLTTCQVSPGNSATARIALKLASKASSMPKWRLVENSTELADEVAQQRKVYKDLSASVERARKEALDASGGAGDVVMRARRLTRRAEEIRGEMTGGMEGTWMTFKGVMQVLTTLGALEVPSDPNVIPRVLPLGLFSRGLQGQNELWLAMALSHPAVMDLTGPQLAAFLGALLSADVPGNISQGACDRAQPGWLAASRGSPICVQSSGAWTMSWLLCSSSSASQCGQAPRRDVGLVLDERRRRQRGRGD
ncbi:hypothetical protein FOA52_000048 [Chlamydomonas sp. UWO 241]|nr:hypothetical protein FOA52_000048 [Chlamydomonas sp. UWO 241]